MAEKYRNEVVFIGVSNNDTVEDGRDYVEEFGVPYAMAHAPEVWDAYGDPLRPSTVVIDAKGRIASTITGPIGHEQLNQIIKQTLAKDR